MAEHGIIGDADYGIDLPQTQVPAQDLTIEKNRAKFSRTKEFNELKEFIDSRIDFYQKVLPDGRHLTAVETQERASQWVIANTVIGEFKMIIDRYETAAEAVKSAS